MRELGKGRWYTGKSPKQRKRDATQLVYGLLPADGSPARFSELRRKAREQGLSTATLSRRLREHVEKGRVAREVDDSTRPPAVRYRRVIRTGLEAKGGRLEELAHTFLFDPWILPFERLEIQDPEVATQLMEKYFKLNMELLSFALYKKIIHYIKEFKEKNEIGRIKSHPIPWFSIDNIRALIGEDLNDWLDYQVYSSMMIFLAMSSRHSDVADPVLKRLKGHHEANFKREFSSLLGLLRGGEGVASMSARVDHVFIHESVVKNRRIWGLVKEVLKRIRDDRDLIAIAYYVIRLQKLEMEEPAVVQHGGWFSSVVFNEARLETKTDEEAMFDIAHVLAHITLNHQGVLEREEEEANELARLWLKGKATL